MQIDSEPRVSVTLDRVSFIDLPLTKELEHFDGPDKEQRS